MKMQTLLIKRDNQTKVIQEVKNFQEASDFLIVNISIFFDDQDEKHTAVINYY